MGKAKRAKLKRVEDQARADMIREQKKADRRDTLKVTAIAVSILLVIAIVVTSCCLIVLSIRSSGNYLRDKVSITSEHFSVNNAMVSYFFRDTFNAQRSYYDYYASYFKLNTSTALREQKYNDSMTWFDYFMSSTASNISNMLILAEAAHDAGMEITDVEESRIDQTINAMQKHADEAGQSLEKYIHENYGLGVKESDIRDALRIYYLNQKFYYTTMGNIEVTEEEIKKQFDEDKNSYLVVDYKLYTFSKTSKGKTADEKGEELAKATDVKEFDRILRSLLEDDKLPEANISSSIEKSLVKDATYSKNSEYSKWLFEDGRKIGDTKVIKADNGNVSVYMVVNAPHRDESETKNVRHILYSLEDYENEEDCKAAAEAILDQFKKDGGGEEAFADLANRYSSDTGSAMNGGLYENVAEGKMVEEFEEWIFDEKRKEGDVDIVKTTYGYHVMYYVGNGRPVWESNVFDKLVNDKYTELAKDYTADYPVKVDYDMFKNIPDIA